MSRWAKWVSDEPKGYFSTFMNEAEQYDQGNPSAGVGASPVEKAKQMGLQSDGHGGYRDPNTGQLVARTVNGELVFYDGGPGGGAVSDGAGGDKLATAQPSWQDPVSGMMMTPPSKPETPEEIAAIPDATPATSPFGYEKFMQQKKMDAYQQREQQPEPGPEGDMGLEGEPMGENYAPQDLAKKLDKSPNIQPVAQKFGDMRRRMNQGDPQTPSITPERQQELTKRLGRLNAPSNLKSGAGANQLSKEDIGSFRNYIKNGPQNERDEINDDELNFAMEHLRGVSGKKWTGFQSRLKGKGDPAPARKVVSRAREVVQSYLMNKGRSSIDGSELPFSDSELDHGVSLSNGGLDNADNWRWLPKRFNQFKGDLDDDALMAALDKEEERQNSPDFKIKTQEDEMTNMARQEWRDQFEKEDGHTGLNVSDIRQAKGKQGLQLLKSLAEKRGISYYKDRGVTRDSGRAGGGTSLGVEELQDRLIDQLGIPDNVDIENFDKGMFDALQKIEDARSDLDSAKRSSRASKKSRK